MIMYRKPILTNQEQIDHLINKGVRFDLISIEEAKMYLDKNNNTQMDLTKVNTLI